MQIMEPEVKSAARCILRFRRLRPRIKVNGPVEARLHVFLWIVINHPVWRLYSTCIPNYTTPHPSRRRHWGLFSPILELTCHRILMFH